MSGTPPIGLDARAAELKEKLLKSRGQSRPKTAQLKADNVNTSPDATTGTVPRAPSSSPPVSGETKSADIIPPETSKPPTPHSFQADEDDIAALISSISGAASRAPEASSSTLNDSLQREKMDTVEVATTPTAPASGNDALPSKPAPKISIPRPGAVEPQSKQSTQQVTRPPTVSSTNQSTPISFQKQSKQPDRGATVPTKSPVEKGESTGKKVGSWVPLEPLALKEPALETPRKAADRDDTKNGNSLKETTALDRDTSKLPKTARPNSHQEASRERTNPTSSSSLTRDQANSRKNSELMGPKPVLSGQNLQITPTKDTGATRAAANNKHTARSEAALSDDVFARLLNQVPDLKDFLEMSDYYDIEARTRKLTRFRRLKALAAEKLKLEEEERKLMQEEELDVGLPRSAAALFASAASSAAPSATPDLETASLPTPVTPVPTSMGTREIRESAPASGTKRAREEDPPQDRQEKAPRLEEPLPPRVKERDDRSRYDDRHREDDRRDERDHRRDSWSRQDDHSFRSSPPRRRHRDEDDYDGRYRSDGYRGDDGHHRDSESRSKYPIHVDLGSKGDSRFFIVKSFNHDNVRLCMEENLWTTQPQNEEILSEAFAKCKNVILFFSINGSKAFQGYARMTSAPSPDNPRPSFVKALHWDTRAPFGVQWLSKMSVHFFRIGHLKNAYNEYQPVLVGKDGQEIDGECGPRLLKEMEDIAAAMISGRGDDGDGGQSWGRYGERRGGGERW
ncbi:YT521-B-like domain-containing protein [Chaetomium tenue]|uniref:YT521-B-like domain-containing protein n=1 Tax=Chaetomium tenue TaxID=1854479 RepID=A0ACB7PGB0_9PEZI|nr:YT521-B-like domain-containing protein [Chaetomium globosum]